MGHGFAAFLDEAVSVISVGSEISRKCGVPLGTIPNLMAFSAKASDVESTATSRSASSRCSLIAIASSFNS